MKTDKIISKTKANYSIIASHFSETRKKNIWIDLRPFLDLVNNKDRVLDVGCGSARLYRVLKEKKIDYLGIDFIEQFIEESKKKYPEAKFKLVNITKKTDWEKVKGKFDVVLCIAVLHHMPDRYIQKMILAEINKKLKENGILILSVWNLWRKKYWIFHLKQVFKKIFFLRPKWLWVSYSLSDGRKPILTVQRFIYSFTQKELETLVENAGFKILRCRQDNNLCLAAKKIV